VQATRSRIVPAAASGLVALVLVSALVVRTSQAAFVDTTSNTGNGFAAGDVNLDDDATTAMFSVSGLAPGDTVTRCIRVTYTGSVSSPTVRLYSGGYTDVPGPAAGSTGLSTYLSLSVEEGAGGTSADCSGFTAASTAVSGVTLAGFAAGRTDFATGAGAWEPATSPASRTYRFTVQLAEATPNAEQGAGVSNAAFVWEVQS
jgi:hypothetical protein